MFYRVHHVLDTACKHITIPATTQEIDYIPILQKRRLPKITSRYGRPKIQSQAIWLQN